MIDKIDKVLHSEFDVKTHVDTFHYYCEVVIWPDGKIEYAVPSHTEKLLQIYCEIHGLTREEAIEDLRTKVWNDCDYVMKETGIIEVWYDYLHNETAPTDAQLKALSTKRTVPNIKISSIMAVNTEI